MLDRVEGFAPSFAEMIATPERLMEAKSGGRLTRAAAKRSCHAIDRNIHLSSSASASVTALARAVQRVCALWTTSVAGD
jgi:hypothetical protein